MKCSTRAVRAASTTLTPIAISSSADVPSDPVLGWTLNTPYAPRTTASTAARSRMSPRTISTPSAASSRARELCGSRTKARTRRFARTK